MIEFEHNETLLTWRFTGITDDGYTVSFTGSEELEPQAHPDSLSDYPSSDQDAQEDDPTDWSAFVADRDIEDGPADLGDELQDHQDLLQDIFSTTMDHPHDEL